MSTHQERVSVLIDRWLDSVITAEELVEMETALLESSAARGDFWRRAGLHGLLHEAARVKFASLPGDGAGAGEAAACGDARHVPARGAVAVRPWPTARIGGWLRPDVAAACFLLVAIGGGIGSFVTSWAAASAGRNGVDGSGPVVVAADGFESPPAPSEDYVPTTLDCWGGDETRVVGAEEWAASGVQPHAGYSMLRFVSGHPRGLDYGGVSSEIWRFVDLDELRAIAGSKDIRVELSAWFNSVAPAEGRRPRCGLRAIATHLGPGQVKDMIWLNLSPLDDTDAASETTGPVAASKSEDLLDADPASWQRLTVMLSLPPGSPRYLLLHCYASDNSEAAARGSAEDRLPGQFVDDITVTVEPAHHTTGAGRVFPRNSVFGSR